MLFVPSTVDDIVRYYKNTYVKFKTFGDDLFYINVVNPQRVQGQHESGDEFILDLHEDAPYEVDYVLPHRAVFQYGESAYLLQRRPERQYHRGLSSNNTHMINVTTGKGIAITFDVLKQFVRKQAYFSLADCVSAKKSEKWNSRALSPRMAYDRSKSAILVDTTPVAKMDTATKCFSMIHPIFRKEVLEIANPSNIGLLP